MKIEAHRARLGAAVLAVFALYAQSAHPAFEVASVRPVDPNRPDAHAIEPYPGGLRLRSLNTIGLLMWAYQIPEANQISGGPEWVFSQDFDVTATTAAPASTEELRAMLQTLLAERFKLVVHREQKIVPLYSLVVGKNGLKIHEVDQAPQSGARVGFGDGVVTYKMVNRIPELVAMLPTFLEERPVQDKTGLTGVYDITLNVALEPEQMKQPKPGHVFRGFGYSPGIFDALEKLGLKLEASKGPVDFFVIDHIERPAAN